MRHPRDLVISVSSDQDDSMEKPPAILHPYLFALFPAVSLVSDHVRFLSLNNTILVMALITMGVTFLSLVLLRAAGMDRRKAGIIVSVSLLLFFSYGHVHDLIASALPRSDFGHRHLLVIWLVLALSLAYFAKKASRHLSTYTKFLNIMGASLVTLSVAQIVNYEIATRDVWEPVREFEHAAAGPDSSDYSPDIYYVILDTYASASTLRQFYDFDNGEFTGWLQERGFFVADESFSNYAKTTLSLASSLNMDYLDKLSPDLGGTLTDRDYEVPKQMIENSSVMWFLKSRGYTFVFVASGQGVTQGNRFADREIRCGYIDETVGRIIQSTLIWPLADRYQVVANDQRNNRLCAFAQLAEMPGMAGPKFVFAHMLVPHRPFLFDANGNPVRASEPGLEQDKEHYLNQLIFVNKRVEEMVTQILAASEVEPIIILQADTGPPYGFEAGAATRNPTDEIYQQNMRILNAYYLPNNDARLLYRGISPVNTFRFVFSTYFDADIPLLADHSYFLTGDKPYRFVDVTASVDYD